MKYVMSFLAAMVLSMPGLGFARQDDTTTLAGLEGFGLLVVYANPYDTKPEQAREKVRIGAVEKLKLAGLPLLETSEVDKAPGRPKLVILIGVIPAPFCGPSDLYEIELKLEEDCTRVRPPAEARRCVTWRLHTHGLAIDPEKEGLELADHALYNVDAFIEVFKASHR
jgi:hypothetical protein